MAFPTSATFWLEGLTASSVILVAVITGLISFYKSRKLKAKLLSYLGLTIFFIGLLYLGPFTDFMSVLITDINIEVPPFNPGDLINAEFVRNYITFYFVAIFLLSSLIFLGIGFAVKAKQSTGELRRKFLYLSLGFIIFVVCGALDSIVTLPVAIGVVRAVMMTFALWMYLGLKT